MNTLKGTVSAQDILLFFSTIIYSLFFFGSFMTHAEWTNLFQGKLVIAGCAVALALYAVFIYRYVRIYTALYS